MGGKPFVSVIIDNYNYGRYLKEAIDSVLTQTYAHFELIVVDDGSTDKSLEIIQSYGHQIVAIFQGNSGQASALNTGITHANGEIICLLDADDYFFENKVEKVVECFDQHPEWVQVSHYCIPIDAQGNTLGRGVNRRLSQGDVKPLLLKYGKYGLARTSALSYRSSVLKNVYPIPSEKDAAADSYLMATVPFYGEIGFIDEPLMYYRIHGKNKHAHSIDRLRIDEHLKERKVVAIYINDVAEKNNLKERFSLSHDSDYRTFDTIQKRLQGIGITPLDFFAILYLALQESLALQRSPQTILTRIIWSSLCILKPSEAKLVLGLGLKRYLKAKIFNKVITSADK